MKAVTVLRRARKLLLTKGWTQDFYFHNGRYCSLGAISAIEGMEYNTDARMLLIAAIGW